MLDVDAESEKLHERDSLHVVLSSICEKLANIQKTQQFILQRLDSRNGSPSPRHSPVRAWRAPLDDRENLKAHATQEMPMSARSDDEVSDTESVSSRLSNSSRSSRKYSLVLPAIGTLRSKRKRKPKKTVNVLPAIPLEKSNQVTHLRHLSVSSPPAAELMEMDQEELPNISPRSNPMSVYSDEELDPELLASLEQVEKSHEAGVILPDSYYKQVWTVPICDWRF